MRQPGFSSECFLARFSKAFFSDVFDLVPCSAMTFSRDVGVLSLSRGAFRNEVTAMVSSRFEAIWIDMIDPLLLVGVEWIEVTFSA